MSALFAELARHETPGGTITLRRRRDVGRDVDVYEVKLGDEFLMSSMFTVGEVALARIGLELLDDDREDVDVVVGGLGLGYTALAVLEDPRVASLLVVEAVAPVIDWHERGLLPDVAGLADDPRVRLVHGDFFALATGDVGFDPARPDQRVDAILVDIDHTPRHLLHPDHAGFYTRSGVAAMRRWLRPGGVFALWSDDPPDHDFLATLATAFDDVDARVVTFRNVLTGGESANTIHVAR